MSEPTNWKKLLLENWIPAMTPAVLAFFGVVFLGPRIHEDYLKRDNFNTDKKEFYNQFIVNYGRVRVVSCEIKLSCANQNKELTDKQSLELQEAFDNLWIGTYNMPSFFRKESTAKLYEFFEWFTKQKFTCSNIDELYNKLFETERSVAPAMEESLYQSGKLL